VSLLHPEWEDYRHARPQIRRAAGLPRSSFLYVADGATVLTRVLGAPDTSPEQFLQDVSGGLQLSRGSLELAAMELSSRTITLWPDLLSAILPAIRPGGSVLIYHKNPSGMPPDVVRNVMTRSPRNLGLRTLSRASVFLTPATPYRAWLSSAFSLALSLARPRTPLAFMKGGALIGLASTLATLRNLTLLLKAAEEPVEMCSSVTIILGPGDSESGG
jgi:hypothetical protein